MFVVSLKHLFMTVISYARQLNTLTSQTSALSMCSVLITGDLVGSLLIYRLKIWTQTWPHTRCH